MSRLANAEMRAAALTGGSDGYRRRDRLGKNLNGQVELRERAIVRRQLDDGEFRRRSGAAWRRSKREWRRGVLRARATCPDFDSSYLCSPPKQLHAATDGKQLRRHCQPTEV